MLDLISEAAAAVNPDASALLDIGCGAGNYTLKLLEHFSHADVDVTLVDISRPMLERAKARSQDATMGTIRIVQADIRKLQLEEDSYDVITAAAVLHHLRSNEEWEQVFKKLFRSLKPDGSLWISGLIEHSDSAVQQIMWERYGSYLTELKDQ